LIHQRNKIPLLTFLYKFAHTSPDRQPFSDLFDTNTNTLPGGFIARFVMGGLYSIPILNAASRGEWPPIQNTVSSSSNSHLFFNVDSE